MLLTNIKSISLDKSLTSDISVQVLATITSDFEHPVKFKITSSNGTVLESTSNFIATPVNLSKFYFLTNKNYFDETSMTITIDVEDSTGVKTSTSKTIDTFTINNVERVSENEFSWSIRNFSTTAIYSMIQIVDESGVVVLNSNEHKKPYEPSYSYRKFLSSTLNELTDGFYSYRVKYYSKDEEWNRYYPSSDGIRFQLRKNIAPRVKIKDSFVRKEATFFQLNSRIIFSDSEMDDIIYKVTDNLGNTLLEKTEYTYSPKLERLVYDYPLITFNSSRLTINVNTNDKLYGISNESETIKLYDIYDLYRDRHKFRWQFRNYSNKNISMQMEATDWYGKIVKVGDVIQSRNSFEYITFHDSVKFTLPREYYKYRLKVWCAEEEWEELYPYKPFNNEIQFTMRDHKPPVLTITKASLYRDLNDTKFLLLSATVTDPENDRFMYKIIDDSGQVIRQTRDYMETPALIEVETRYDSLGRSRVGITMTVEDDNGGIDTKTVYANAYRIYNLTELKGHIFNWYVDNYSAINLNIQLEILKLDAVTGKLSLVQSGTDFTVGSTIRPSLIEDRLLPKLSPGVYYYRLKVESYEENIITYYPNEEGIEFTALKNNPPVIELDSLSLEKIDDSSFLIDLEATIIDHDLDTVTYDIKDQFGRVLQKSDTPKKTPLPISMKSTYNIDDLDAISLFLSISALDEVNAMETFTREVRLYDIQNLYKDYQTFYWLFRNYSKMPVMVQLEILNSEGHLYGAGAINAISTQMDYREYKDSINFFDYKEGNYFYRLKVSDGNNKQSSYYPNVNGIAFKLKHNHNPVIDVNEISIDKVIDQPKYLVNFKASITDKNGEKVYYTVKDSELKGG